MKRKTLLLQEVLDISNEIPGIEGLLKNKIDRCTIYNIQMEISYYFYNRKLKFYREVSMIFAIAIIAAKVHDTDIFDEFYKDFFSKETENKLCNILDVDMIDLDNYPVYQRFKFYMTEIKYPSSYYQMDKPSDQISSKIELLMRPILYNEKLIMDLDTLMDLVI